ncbi:MAG: hypothetical protein AMXMBFR13_28040 [Phycisphaerae bacterium]
MTYLAIPFMSVVLLGVFWPRANYAGGIFGVVGGVVLAAAAMTVSILGRVWEDAPRLFHLHWLYVGFVVQVITMAGIVLVSLLTPAPPVAQWEPFLWGPGLLKGLTDGRRRPWYQSITLWFTAFAAVWLWAYWRFW